MKFIKFKNCHPHPCLDGNSTRYKYVLVAVRDPVDRFRSAFDYMPTFEAPAHRNILKMYGHDANRLALAVCDDDPQVGATPVNDIELILVK